MTKMLYYILYYNIIYNITFYINIFLSFQKTFPSLCHLSPFAVRCVLKRLNKRLLGKNKSLLLAAGGFC